MSPCEKGSVTSFEFFGDFVSPPPCTPIKRMYGKRGQFCPRVKKGSVTDFKKILSPLGTNRGTKGNSLKTLWYKALKDFCPRLSPKLVTITLDYFYTYHPYNVL